MIFCLISKWIMNLSLYMQCFIELNARIHLQKINVQKIKVLVFQNLSKNR